MKRFIAIFTVLALFMSLTAPSVLALTLEEERDIGRKAMQQVMAEIPMIEDPDILSYIRNLGARLARQLDDNPWEFKFYVANLDEMNAFALPGGWMVFFRGMITDMDSEAELAGVMAHEMSHVYYRHISSRIKRSGPVNALTVAGMIAGMILGGLAGLPQLGQAITMGSVAGGIQKQLEFSREDERQADYGAFLILTKAGYPPEEMEKSFARIYRETRNTSPDVPGYLRTHPTSPERMETLQNLVRRHPTKNVSYDNSEFLRVRTKLIALYDSEDTAERKLMNQTRSKSEELRDLARYGMGLLETRRKHYERALKHLQLVGGKWKDSPAVIRARAICLLRLGQFDRAGSILARVLARNPKDVEALLTMGQIYLQNDKPQQAEEYFREVLKLTPDSEQAQYDLGVALGRIGRTAEASLYLGLAFKARRNQRAARYHLEKAAKELSGRPELANRARKALDEMDEIKKKRKPEDSQEGSGFSMDRKDASGMWITDPSGVRRRIKIHEPSYYPERQ
jgi:beta-barrel assembly-enhancing protease